MAGQLWGSEFFFCIIVQRDSRNVIIEKVSKTFFRPHRRNTKLCWSWILLHRPFLPTITIYLIKQNLGVESINTKWFPTLTLVTSAVAMPAAGALERRNIFKATLFLSAMFCSLGILLSHLSVKSGYACFMLTYCVMYGIGFGLNYSTTPFVVLEWYPNNQCLACGSVFFGLGVGWILFSQIQTYIVKSQKCDFVFINGTNCEAPDKVPSVFMINGSIIFAVQMLGTVLMKKRESNEFHHEDYHSSEEASLETDTSTCPDVNPRDLVHYRGFYILWMLQLIECFPTMIFLTFYKSIGFATIEENLFVRIVSDSSAAFLLVGFILWSFLADKLSYKIPLLIVALCRTIGLAIFPQCLELQPIKFFYAILVFISVLCIAGYRILIFVTVAKAFGVKYLGFNFACINTASIFGGLSCTLFVIYFPVLEKIDNVLYICAALNAIALLLLAFLPDRRYSCTCSKSAAPAKEAVS
ncbi:hypothetical protein TcWFU_001683 [Taenia crassiceps]|uniref:Uncharacterized protein n=1 Tax=Taenia crassiceps TaxID=6207 RepID=A0ABR4QQR2_9CEST